jgi:predicted nuclease of predicted toxin-antitoxin system
LRLILDENVSPSNVRPLSEAGHDVYHVRDRGLTGQPDNVILRRAVDENRIVVPINARDFVRLARQEELRGGLVTFPSGARPHEQLALILRAIGHLEAEHAQGRDPMNRWLDISHAGAIRVIDLPPAAQ